MYTGPQNAVITDDFAIDPFYVSFSFITVYRSANAGHTGAGRNKGKKLKFAHFVQCNFFLLSEDFFHR
jgi:hypothetical protein